MLLLLWMQETLHSKNENGTVTAIEKQDYQKDRNVLVMVVCTGTLVTTDQDLNLVKK